MADDTAVVFADVLGRAEDRADRLVPSSGTGGGGIPTGVGMQDTLGIDADEFAKALDLDGYIVIR